jgi:hypothetical protein
MVGRHPLLSRRWAQDSPHAPMMGGSAFSQIVYENIHKASVSAYDLGMATIEQYLDDRLALGRAYFSREEAMAALGSSPAALNMALTRQAKKGRLANPRHGFYLILRPETGEYSAQCDYSLSGK